jgi:hypothetical protein
MSNNLHVIYAYYEKNDMYRLDLIYFLSHGYQDDVDYTIVINDKCSVTIPDKTNIHVIYRENVGFDFQGYYAGILSLINRRQIRNTDYYLFLNCTVCGPFLPIYVKSQMRWYEPYIHLLTDNVKLVGSTINLDPCPHVQSYMFLMDYQGIQFLLEKEFFKIYETREEVIEHQEIGMSRLFLGNGWNISCLIPEYQGIDYTQTDLGLRKGDIRHSRALLGRDLLPYEVIFTKSMWGDQMDQIASLLRLNLPQMDVQKNTCHKVTYGVDGRKGLNVTKLLRKIGAIDAYRMLPNEMFGDPAQGHPKCLWIQLVQRSEPIILREHSGRFRCDGYKYIFHRDGKNLQLWSYLDVYNLA